MTLMDAFTKEDRVPVMFSTFYELMKESAKCELLMNAVRCKVPHEFIYEMATGEKAPVQEQEDEA